MTLARIPALLAILFATELSAQSSTDLPVAPGTGVGVTVPDSARQEPIAPRTQQLRGEVAALSVDTLSLRVAGTGTLLAVPRSAVRRLDVSKGVPSRLQSAVEGAVGGAVIGALYAFALRQLGSDEWNGRSRTDVLAIGAAYGSATRLVFGALSPVERWRRISFPEQPRER